MENCGELTGLIEQAALMVNMLDSSDISGIESLQEILDQIHKTVREAEGVSSQVLEEVKGKSSDAAGMIEKILHQEIKDSDEVIRLLSGSIIELQGLISKITQSDTIPDAPQSNCPSINVEGDLEELVVVSEEDKALVMDFIGEANEHIEACEAGLLALENRSGDNETLNQIFRGFHTIKGMAGFLNLSEIGSLAHSAENLLDLARKGELVLSGDNTNVIFESIDMMKKMITCLQMSLESGGPVPGQPQLPALLAKVKAVVESHGSDSVMNTPKGLEDDVKLDTVLTASDRATDDVVEKLKTHVVSETIKVNTTRLDNLINMVGELVIAQLMIGEDANTILSSDHSMRQKIAHQSKIIRELQELSMSMRMVPISGVFQKMTRLVRDLSHKGGKTVKLTMSGEDTELDRNIVDKIADPLVHMIRNSVDHGIEGAEERIKAGKSTTGEIKLRTFHQSGNIVIEIGDDGKGLNKDRILKKAIDNGLVGADQQLSDQEIYKLIYHAGLSTAKKITSVSGRGVGMDVVRKNIESLRGRIDINSIAGVGTTFTIRLPLTLAIIDGQVIKVGNERFIIPISSIVQSFRPEAKQVSTVQGRGEVVMFRDQLLPLMKLHELFSIKSSVHDVTKALLVVVEEDGTRCCVLVDELLGQQQVVIKSLGEGLGTVKGISGGAIMGDGKVSLILDVPGLIMLAQC